MAFFKKEKQNQIFKGRNVLNGGFVSQTKQKGVLLVITFIMLNEDGLNFSTEYWLKNKRRLNAITRKLEENEYEISHYRWR